MTLPQLAWALGARPEQREEVADAEVEKEFNRLWRTAISQVIRKYCILPYELLQLDVIRVCQDAAGLMLMPKGPPKLRIWVGNVKRRPIIPEKGREVIVEYLRWIRDK
jgi:hypothetical protein